MKATANIPNRLTRTIKTSTINRAIMTSTMIRAMGIQTSSNNTMLEAMDTTMSRKNHDDATWKLANSVLVATTMLMPTTRINMKVDTTMGSSNKATKMSTITTMGMNRAVHRTVSSKIMATMGVLDVVVTTPRRIPRPSVTSP